MPFGRRLDRSGGYRCKFQEMARTTYDGSPMGAAYARWAAVFDPDGASEIGWREVDGGEQRSVDAEYGDDPLDEYAPIIIRANSCASSSGPIMGIIRANHAHHHQD